MSDPRSMGSEFMQRRAAAAASNKPTTTGGGTNLTSLGSAGKSPAGGGSSGPSSGGGGGKKSFADIQREQEREARRGSGPPRGGGGMGGRGTGMGGGLQRQPQQQPRPARVLQRPQPAGDDPSRPSRPSDRDYNPRGSGHQRSSHRSSHQPDPRSALPLEQGSVHTLLDKFGFIVCADRDAELFFHYSQCKSGHSDDLNVGDEVEFRVGRSEDRGRRNREGEGDKLCALEVRLLEKGTIAWETEDQPGKRWKGQVERAAREEHRRRDGGRGGGSAAGGAIRLLDDDHDDEKGGDTTTEKAEKEGEDKAPPGDVHYRPADYQPAHRGPGPSRLERRDLVEFDLFTERRTGRKFARNISLVQSERERLHNEREAKLMENATLEQGRVVRERGDQGVLQSVARAEEIHFHVSHLVDLPGKKGAEEGMEKRGGLVGDVRSLSVLREGQEVEFYVVDEGSLGGGSGGGGGGSGGGGGRPRNGPQGLSARKIQLLPPGTVQFEHVLAAGVTGTVVACPVPAAPGGFGRRDGRDRRSAPDASAKAPTMGTVRLAKPLQTEDGTQVTEVFLAPDDYPGGSFNLSRTGGERGIWIRPGDVVLFDVVRKVVDGSCHAVPTTCLSASEEGAASEAATPDAPDASKAAKAAVRLVDLSLLGRAEGIIKSVQDAFGFVTLAERNVDAYFPLFEVFPAEMQGDLAAAAKSNDAKDGGAEATKGGRVDVAVGTEVSFDLALQPPDPRRGGGGGRYGRPGSQADKESFRARRLRLLPTGTVLAKIPVAAGAKATVTKVESRQPFAGTLELESPIERSNPLTGRHPLLARLVEDVAHGRYGEEGATFPEALGEADARTAISMVDARDDLGWGYVGEGAEGDPGKRRLCISRAKEGADESPKSADSEKAEAADEVDAAVDASANASSTAATVAAPKTKTKKAAPKIVRTVRYDKSSFPDLSSGPLGIGDVTTCDVVQLRRSGALLAANLAVVSRKAPAVAVGADGAAGNKEGVGVTGIVAEVVPARGFGFITAVDAEGRRGDHVFFHFNELAAAAGDEAAAAEAPPSAAAGGQGKKRRDNTTATIVISKGDEVKFDVAPGKNGKLCATHVTLLPRGTLKLPPKADAPPRCTGYVLLEPSRAALARAPAHRRATSSGPAAKEGGGGGGRWDNVRDETAVGKSGAHVKEDGILLLLTDPGHLFSPKPKRAKTVAAEVSNGAVEKESKTADGSADTSPESSAPSADETDAKAGDDLPAPAAIGIHLRYKLNALVGRGRSEPRRGDLVAFGKTRGAPIVKEVRVEAAAAATSVRGALAELDLEGGTAVFVSAEKEGEKYEIGLDAVVSCDRALLKEQEQVDGILHEGKIFGVCRTKDIFLASSISKYSSGGSSAAGGPPKERPRLNLTVKKGLGGQIMAQSRMAKGPDGTTGFVRGWTTRVSEYAVEEEEEAEEDEAEEGDIEEDHPARALSSLSLAAAEFVPTVATATSGFESTDE